MKTIFTCSHGAKREKGRLQDKFYLMLPFEHKKKKKTISSFHSTCIKLISGRIHTKTISLIGSERMVWVAGLQQC